MIFSRALKALTGEHVHLVDDVDPVFAALAGDKFASSRRSRILSTPLLLAASISTYV